MSFIGNILHSRVQYVEIKPRELKRGNGVGQIIADITAVIETVYPDINNQNKLRDEFSKDIREWAKKGNGRER